MQFQISDEMAMTRSVVREFAEREVAPHAGERDEKEQFERRLFDKMGELGITGIPIPDQYGGAGGDFLTYVIVLEELARVCASTSAVLASHTAASSWSLYKFGNEEIKQHYLRDLASGVKLGGYGALGVRENGDRFVNKLFAHSDEADYVELNGVHPLVINAGIADLYVIFAQSGSTTTKDKNFNAYIVEDGVQGLYNGARLKKLGLRSLMTDELIFKQCRLPLDNRIGKEGQGQEIAMEMMAIGHISAAAQAVGIAQGAFEAAITYAKERKQFGRQIGKQQAIAFKIADMSAKIEAARLMNYQAAWRMNEGLSSCKGAAIAKKFAADIAVAVTLEAIQVYGGYGYMREYRIERFLRDAKCLELDIGSGSIYRDLIIRILAAD